MIIAGCDFDTGYQQIAVARGEFGIGGWDSVRSAGGFDVAFFPGWPSFLHLVFEMAGLPLARRPYTPID
jgi:hypothetical protein